MKFEEIKFDCKHFRGDIPCAPNKLRGKVCNNCDEYLPISKKILIIKLGAIGDVIRSTSLAVRYREIYPDCHITWLTHFPEVLPKDSIDEIHKFDFRSVYILSHQKFDIAVNLDKDVEVCALLKNIDADEKHGFTWDNGHIAVSNKASEHKLITGLFDQYSKANTKSYLEEIFEICGFTFNKEPYLLNVNPELCKRWNSLKEKAEGKTIVGLNTGCGRRWLTRLWPSESWVALIKQLQQAGFYPLLLGGPDEDMQNKTYAQQTGAYYPGTFSLENFIAISWQCDIIVTAVTMMMHIAIGLKKPLILFNNIFNKNEFELYGRGTIIEPISGCDCYYGNECKRQRHCMEDISVEAVFDAALEYSPAKP